MDLRAVLANLTIPGCAECEATVETIAGAYDGLAAHLRGDHEDQIGAMVAMLAPEITANARRLEAAVDEAAENPQAGIIQA